MSATGAFVAECADEAVQLSGPATDVAAVTRAVVTAAARGSSVDACGWHSAWRRAMVAHLMA